MDEFSAFVFGSIVVVFLILIALGKYYPGNGLDQVDWQPTRSPEVEVQNEIDDLDQMLEAQNERRRRTGRPEITEDDVHLQVADDERWRQEQLARYDDEDDKQDAT